MEVFAGKVVAQRDEEGWLLGFADREFDTENYLLLQRAFDFDERDHALGMATYHLEVDDPANALYGGLSRAVLHTDRIELEFTGEGGEAVGIDEPLTIRFDPAGMPWDELADVARQVLGDLLEIGADHTRRAG